MQTGSVGLGHVRYPTAGTSSVQEAQPFFVNSPLGMYLVHNGNITNTDELKVLLNSSSSFFNRYLRTNSDSEVTPSVGLQALQANSTRRLLQSCNGIACFTQICRMLLTAFVCQHGCHFQLVAYSKPSIGVHVSMPHVYKVLQPMMLYCWTQLTQHNYTHVFNKATSPCHVICSSSQYCT